MKTGETKNFREFLRTYLKEDSLLGDLARDSFANPFWSGTTIDSLKKQLEDFHACKEAWKALNTAIRLYEPKKGIYLRYMGSKDGLSPEGVNYVIKAFRSHNIEITATEGGFNVNPTSAKQKSLVSLMCADFNLGQSLD